MSIQNFGDNLGRRPNPFLIQSNQGKALSARAVTDIFHTLFRHLEPEARKALADRRLRSLRPHDTRHTAVVTRLKTFVDQGMSLEGAIERCRPYFGWGLKSRMPLYYARAYFETKWDEVYLEVINDHVDALRSIGGLRQ